MIIYILGWVLKIEGLFLLPPCIVALIYREKSGYAFLITMAICLVIGFTVTQKKPRNTAFFSREGFTSVSLSWIILSIFGTFPYMISGEIPSFGDALFESISGFTTTGASVLSDVEALSHCCLFWRSFTQWIGGMGVLVFILAILPLRGGTHVYLMRAESPGPSVSKLVPKLKSTAMILYGIYVAITIIEVIFLLLGGMPLFDALTISLSTAGTGGFAIKNNSIGSYSTYLQVVITVFMILCGMNFNAFYFLITKRFKNAFRMEEVRAYLGIILVATGIIAFNIRGLFPSIFTAIQQAAFQVSSTITTTAYITTDFNTWPEMSRTILITLMFIGACAGSTGGGIKISRLVILVKTIKKEIIGIIHPRSIRKIKMDGHPVEHEVVRATNVFFIAYMLIFAASLLLLSVDGFDFITNFTAVTASLNNIGPGMELVGPTGNYSIFSGLPKFVLMADMLIGRLEIFPMLVLLSPRTWTR